MPNNKKIIATIDGNEAAAYVAYRVNEVCAIYPITPSSTMAELDDEMASKGTKNKWGNKTDVEEMQSEGGGGGTDNGAGKYRFCGGGAQFQTDAPAACGFFEITAGGPFGNYFTAGEGGCA